MMIKADWSDASTSQGTPKTVSKPPEAKKKQGRIPYRLQRGHGPVDTLISISSLQKCDIINHWCSKPPSLWYFAMAALGN